MQFEAASAQLVTSAYPLEGTPPRYERVNAAQTACRKLSELAVDAAFDTSVYDLSHHTYVPLGIYATRDAILEYVATDKVSLVTAKNTSEQVSELCESLQSAWPVSRGTARRLGCYAELGILNAAWLGAASQSIPLEYAFLLGVRGRERTHTALRGDIDMVARTNADGTRNKTSRLQIKASNKKARYIYDKSIKVITAQSMVPGHSVVNAVSRLMRAHTLSSRNQDTMYEKFWEVVKPTAKPRKKA